MNTDASMRSRREVMEPYAFASAAVFAALGVNQDGLSQATARQRQAAFGPNSLPPARAKSRWLRFLSQFNNLLIYLLLASGAVSALLQHYVDAGVIFGVVIVNGIVGFIQEGRAEEALRSILSMTRTRCLVLRDGISVTLDSEELVPGDVVLLKAGDRVPADLRLFQVWDLQCDESALTGESQQVMKQTDALAEDVLLAERTNMVYMGTMIASGAARGVVCQTGVHTQIGGINTLVQNVAIVQTPLQRQMSRFARVLTLAIVLLAFGVILIGLFLRHYAFADMVQAAIGIAVASIPEAMPAIVTVTLAIGVMRMARRQALVRRLPAVEVLGSVDVICADKTGTLTANVMSVRELVTAEHLYRISGESYRPEGEVLRCKDRCEVAARDDALIHEAGRIALLCNDANLVESASDWQLHGNPTEGALLTFAIKSGLDAGELRDLETRLDVIPFDSEHRYMASMHGSADSGQWLAIKGAPDKLLEFCRWQLQAGGKQEIDLQFWQEQLEDLAGRGMRVMALARRDLDDRQALNRDYVERDLVLVALAGISDPPRPEARQAVANCRTAGITVKMITGDNPVTAAAIGRELGLNADRVLTGRELDALDAEQLATAVREVDIFARTSPANKLQLVEALQQQGRVVAMTGDGVNDAPALRKADIGVAMGRRGTDAAREAADFVLTDDNFSSIAAAVAEGRTVYDNIHKSVVYILPTSMAEAAVICAAILLGLVLPITPVQVLWINMTTEITLSLALVFERSESSIMQRPPRKRSENLINRALFLRLLLVAGWGALMVFFLFRHYLASGASVEYARAVAVTALVFFEAFYLLNCRFLNQSSFHRRLFQGAAPTVYAIAAVLLLQAAFLYLPVMQQLFAVSPLAFRDWLIIAATGATIMPLVELEKAITRRRLARRGILTG